MEQLVNILQYLKDHPEVTWSGTGLTALAVLCKLLALLFRKGRGHDAGVEEVRIQQTVKGDNNIVVGTGDVKVERR